MTVYEMFLNCLSLTVIPAESLTGSRYLIRKGLDTMLPGAEAGLNFFSASDTRWACPSSESDIDALLREGRYFPGSGCFSGISSHSAAHKAANTAAAAV